VVIPYLTLETVAYKYGLKANAEQTFTYRGDAMYYIPGIPWRDTAAGGSATYNFANGPAIVYHEAASGGIANIYAVSVCWHDPTTGLYKRLFHGSDYTDTNTAIPAGLGSSSVGLEAVSVDSPPHGVRLGATTGRGDMGILEGKVALVSGAARGQGEGEARRFAAEGASVVLGDVA